jgi:hypothetical protein
MKLLHYLVFLVLYLGVNAGSSDAGKKGPKVTDKVSLALPQLYSVIKERT